MTTQTTTSDAPNPYKPPSEVLDQGDVVPDVPWGLVKAPAIVCRPHHGINATSGDATFGIATNVKDAFRRNDAREIVHATTKRGLVLVLWHGCQIDKFAEHDKQDKAFVAVVPILPLTQLNELDRAAVRNREHFGRFHLPAFSTFEFTMSESYADLRHIWPIAQGVLKKPVVSLTSTALALLYGQLFTFLTRQRFVENAKCPSCGAVLPTSMFFSPTAE